MDLCNFLRFAPGWHSVPPRVAGYFARNYKMSGKSKTLTLIFGLLFLSFPFASVFADDFSVTINEVCWMGNADKATNEWIELYNNKNEPVSLENWLLKIDDTEIRLKGAIGAQGYYLISRNKTIGADLVFTKSLKNTGNKISLLDDKKNIIEEMDWSSGWPAGNNKTKQTMERIDPLLSGTIKANWQTGKIAEGTPKAKNSEGTVAQKESNAYQNINQADLSQSIYPQKIDPKGADKSPLSLQSIFFAMLLSLFSGAIILFLKKYLSGKDLL